MPNPYFNKQVSNLKPTTGPGKKPISGGAGSAAMPMRTAAWPGLPGKAGPNRSAGVPEEKVYARAVGIAGGKDDDDL